MKDEDVVDGEKDQDEPEAGKVAVEEGDDGVGQGGQEAAEMNEGENRVEQRRPATKGRRKTLGASRRERPYLPTTVAERMVIGSSGTFWWPRLLPVGTLAMASTTSIPATTLPKTQYFIWSRLKLSTRLM